MYRANRVAVVMPMHNEEEHVAYALARVPEFVDVIVAIDDGSNDRTWQRLRQIRSERVDLLQHGYNCGVGAATKTGYRRALELDSDLIAVMDGDGQMDGGDLSGLLDCALEGNDYVKGNRFLDLESLSSMPLPRLIGNTVLSRLTRTAAKFSSSLDAQCGYTVIRRSALEKLDLASLYDRYGFPNEMFFAVLEAKLRVACVPVRSVYGSEVSGINPFTAVPIILSLIAKGYLRRRSQQRRTAVPLEIGAFESSWATRGSESGR